MIYYRTVRDEKPEPFTNLYAVNPNLQLFTLASAEVLDKAYLTLFGKRKCAQWLVEGYITPRDLAEVLNAMYGDKWDALIKGYKQMTEDASTGGAEHIEETITTTETPGGVVTTVNEVSPYNEQEFTNNDKSTVTNSGTNTTERNRVYDRVAPDTEYQKFAIELLTTDGIFGTIYTDINRVYTLSVY